MANRDTVFICIDDDDVDSSPFDSLIVLILQLPRKVPGDVAAERVANHVQLLQRKPRLQQLVELLCRSYAHLEREGDGDIT